MQLFFLHKRSKIIFSELNVVGKKIQFRGNCACSVEICQMVANIQIGKWVGSGWKVKPFILDTKLL